MNLFVRNYIVLRIFITEAETEIEVPQNQIGGTNHEKDNYHFNRSGSFDLYSKLSDICQLADPHTVSRRKSLYSINNVLVFRLVVTY